MAKKMKAHKPKPRKYPGEPRTISNKPDKMAWFYTQPEGLLVVTELRPNGVYQGTTQAKISWRKVLDAVAVHNRIRR